MDIEKKIKEAEAEAAKKNKVKEVTEPRPIAATEAADDLMQEDEQQVTREQLAINAQKN